MAFKCEGKETYPNFVFAKCCWSVHSKVVRGLASMRTAESKQRKDTSTQTLQFHIKFMCIPC